MAEEIVIRLAVADGADAKQISEKVVDLLANSGLTAQIVAQTVSTRSSAPKPDGVNFVFGIGGLNDEWGPYAYIAETRSPGPYDDLTLNDSYSDPASDWLHGIDVLGGQTQEGVWEILDRPEVAHQALTAAGMIYNARFETFMRSCETQ